MIQFSQQEIADTKGYLKNIESTDTGFPLQEPERAFPEGSRIFLLLRKLLAYGVHHNLSSDPDVSYLTLQKKSQKASDMRVTVHAYAGQFNHLLATYVAHHQG